MVHAQGATDALGLLGDAANEASHITLRIVRYVTHMPGRECLML